VIKTLGQELKTETWMWVMKLERVQDREREAEIISGKQKTAIKYMSHESRKETIGR